MKRLALALLGVVGLTPIAACGRLNVELLQVDDGPGGNPDASEDAGGPPVGVLDGSIVTDDAGQPNGPDASGNGSDAGGGEIDVCVLGVCASEVDRCPDDAAKNSPGICGCGVSDGSDLDEDGTPDCVDRCPGRPDALQDGTCGCAAAMADSDGDGLADCQDRCPADGDKTAPAVCGCGISDDDGDVDGMPDCADACAEDAAKVQAGICGCSVPESDLDTDSDGQPDCIDVCNGVDDASYVPDDGCGTGYCNTTNTVSTCVDGVETACAPGTPLSAADATCDGVDDDCDGAVDEEYMVTPTSCGTGACAQTGTLSCVNGSEVDSCAAGAGSASDTTCDGIDDDCSGAADEDYVPTATSCGRGACLRSGTRTCSGGLESDSCVPGTAAANDANCNGVDEDCSGTADDDYVPPTTSCGEGVCVRSGQLLCSGGTTNDTCTPGTPATNVDDATWPGNGADDDCDGDIDEDSVPPCADTTPKTFGAGNHSVTTPTGCTTVTVQLWGAGGGSGGRSSGDNGTPGRGGAGGYASSTITLSGALRLYVGNGGTGCSNGGTNPGASTYNGGAGGADGITSTAGSAGADGVVAGGGTGGNSTQNGGRGFYGGGGGGGGGNAPWPPYAARGGGGGSATVLLMGSSPVVVAGGGGGGGGMTGFGALAAGNAGVGGEGCSGNGGSGGSDGGGGGGGGVCVGTTTQQGSNGVPANATAISTAGRARGGAPTGSSACISGGSGHAILVFGN